MRSWSRNSWSTKDVFVLRGDIVKDDSGGYAVFTEQCSSASQMTAAKVTDVIARLPECDGQAADAISACTKKMEDDPKLLTIPKSGCPVVWTHLPKHEWPQPWNNIVDPVLPLERTLYGHPVAGLLWERQFAKSLMELGWEKLTNWEWLFVHLSIDVDDVKKWLEESKIWLPCLRNWWRTSGVYSTLMRTKWQNYWKIQCSNHVFLLEERKNCRNEKNHDQKFLRGPTMWKHMHENVWKGTANWPTKKTENSIRFLVFAGMITK